MVVAAFLDQRIGRQCPLARLQCAALGVQHLAQVRLAQLVAALCQPVCAPNFADAVAPGIVSTDMSEALVGAHEQEIQSRLLIKRFARPEEIADAVLYLAERGLYVTGEVLPVNGGLKML